MYLRRNSKTKMEVSIDEPLNVDWDGNELLLSDILGTDEESIKILENEAERKILKGFEQTVRSGKMIVRTAFRTDHPMGRKDTERGGRYAWNLPVLHLQLEKKIMGRLKKEIVRFE